MLLRKLLGKTYLTLASSWCDKAATHQWLLTALFRSGIRMRWEQNSDSRLLLLVNFLTKKGVETHLLNMTWGVQALIHVILIQISKGWDQKQDLDRTSLLLQTFTISDKEYFWYFQLRVHHVTSISFLFSFLLFDDQRCADAKVSNKTLYPTFARTLAPSSKVSKALIATLKHFNWKKVQREIALSNEKLYHISYNRDSHIVKNVVFDSRFQLQTNR